MWGEALTHPVFHTLVWIRMEEKQAFWGMVEERGSNERQHDTKKCKVRFRDRSRERRS